MARSSTAIGLDIASTTASNVMNQNGINQCTAKMQDIQTKINVLYGQKSTLESTYSIYYDLKDYIARQLENLEESSVCITEIKGDVNNQIIGKIDSALKAIETMTNNLQYAIGNAQTEYNTVHSQKQTYENNLSKGQQHLGTLKTEFREAKAQEAASL